MSDAHEFPWTVHGLSKVGVGPLVPVQDVLSWSGHARAYDAGERVAMAAVAGYISGFLTSRDPVVGRAGPVCPFTPGALRRRAMLVTAWRGTGDDALLASAAALGDLFSAAWPWGGPDGPLRSLTMVLPRVDVATGSAMVVRAQAALKPSFVARGMMLGEFFPDSEAPGLHNPDFRPLRSPVPCLAVRQMAAADEVFLRSDPVARAAYLERFPAGPRRLPDARP